MKQMKRYLFILLALIVFTGSGANKVFAKSVPLVSQLATVNASSLRLRSGPSTDHATISTAPGGDYVMITGKSGAWYQVSYNLKQGYMHERYLNTYSAKNTELGYGIVTADKVNLRSGPGISYRSVAQASNGEKAYIIGFNQQWYKVICREQICYIRSDYLKLTQIPYENQGSVNTPLFFRNGKSTGIAPSAAALKGAVSQATGTKIVAEAKKYLGVPYAWGGSTPSGFDCSGFVQYVLQQCGITVPRTTELQVQIGTYINKTDLNPGDLVFLQNTYRAGISHVGFYIGNDQMIHASSSKGITISSLTATYYQQHYHSARRLIL
jgi:cell wall-associated NlpC family hydrolase